MNLCWVFLGNLIGSVAYGVLIAIAYTAHSQARGAVAGELSANAAHGVPRTTNEDKRRAVLTLLNGKRPPTEVALAFHVLCMFG